MRVATSNWPRTRMDAGVSSRPSSSVGAVGTACHAEGRGFESLHPLRKGPGNGAFLLPESDTKTGVATGAATGAATGSAYGRQSLTFSNQSSTRVSVPHSGQCALPRPSTWTRRSFGRVPERRDRGGRIVRPLGAPGVGIDGVELCAAVPTDDRLASGHDSIVGTGATLCHFHDQFPGDPLAPRSRSPRHSTPCALATRM